MLSSDRRTAIAVGILFIIATAFLYIGESVYAPFLEAPDYLQTAFPNRTVAVAGMLLEFACVIAIPLISVFLFPVLRRFDETLAIGYVGFRFFEVVLFAHVEINKLSLINASEGYRSAAGGEALFFRDLGSSIQSTNGWIFSIYVVVFGVGALMLYSAFLKSKLVPSFHIDLGTSCRDHYPCGGNPGDGYVRFEYDGFSMGAALLQPDCRQRNGARRLAHRKGFRFFSPLLAAGAGIDRRHDEINAAVCLVHIMTDQDTRREQ